jgi:uncharacterized membrane protein YgcG
MKFSPFQFLSFLIILFTSITHPASNERILSFDSDITINVDGSMIVIEKIKAEALGINIKRGIFRDFPTQYKDQYNNNYNVQFEVLSIKRDGNPEDYHTENLSNGIRVYCGRKDYFLPNGVYTYEIKYKTNRQLGYFDGFDEIYWNVTGNGWDFMIENASATVHLPLGIMRSDIKTFGYTGQQGERGALFRSEIISGSEIKFNTTGYLYPREGLTIVVQFPKGIVSEPTQSEKLEYFFGDNRALLIGIAGIIILILYYLIVWFRVGKDPTKGTIIPLYSAPDNLSPGAVRFISEMSFDNKTFTAGIVSLAVNGCLKIEEKKNDYTLHKLSSSYQGISKEESVLLNSLPSKLELKQTYHTQISNAIKKFKESLKNSYEKHYFFTNSKFFVIGIVFTLFILILIGISYSGDALFSLVWLSFWSMGVCFLIFTVFKSWKGAIVNGRIKAAAFGGALFITLFSIPFIIGEIVGFVLFSTSTSPLMIIVLALMAALNIIFYHLLKAPTLLGRRAMDKIEGLKMYLSVAEKDRLNAMQSPDKTPEVFEKFLPYALALNVENKWAELFSEKLNVKDDRYSPAWYSGTSWSTLGAAGFASSLGSSLSSTISSSSTAPGSSSGGGSGGSSGGGGGGGGGGGW